ncbi:hypothetical protein VTK56DRAFT_2050 [Thermocarpiscus australiensis]
MCRSSSSKTDLKSFPRELYELCSCAWNALSSLSTSPAIRSAAAAMAWRLSPTRCFTLSRTVLISSSTPSISSLDRSCCSNSCVLDSANRARFSSRKVCVDANFSSSSFTNACMRCDTLDMCSSWSWRNSSMRPSTSSVMSATCACDMLHVLRLRWWSSDLRLFFAWRPSTSPTVLSRVRSKSLPIAASISSVAWWALRRIVSSARLFLVAASTISVCSSTSLVSSSWARVASCSFLSPTKFDVRENTSCSLFRRLVSSVSILAACSSVKMRRDSFCTVSSS